MIIFIIQKKVMSGEVKTEGEQQHYSKKTIPKALRNQVWIKSCGESFHHKCKIRWCTTTMTVFDFQAGHNIPESKGGSTTLDNLHAICSTCNTSMGNRYSIEEWNKLGGKEKSSCFGWCCFSSSS